MFNVAFHYSVIGMTSNIEQHCIHHSGDQVRSQIKSWTTKDISPIFPCEYFDKVAEYQLIYQYNVIIGSYCYYVVT